MNHGLAEGAPVQEVPLALHKAVPPGWSHALRHHQGQWGIGVHGFVVGLHAWAQGGGAALLEALRKVGRTQASKEALRGGGGGEEVKGGERWW